MEYVLTTEALCKYYKHFKALNGLTMHVPKGAIYGIVGKNGAGKTTLIRLLCGLQEPTKGSFTCMEYKIIIRVFKRHAAESAQLWKRHRYT